ncbi:MAG: hypothetical protein HY033_13945 [Ignavibacteriae bacterium]|nr:hypothetical protein [Ignavibacteriota bacterium]
MQTIIGLSPGSRHIGVAVLQDGTLKEWRITGIRAGMLEQKVQMLRRMLDRLYNSYQPTSIAIKGVRPSKNFLQLNRVTREIKQFAQERDMNMRIFSLGQLKNILKVPNRKDRCFMADVIAEHYPVLYSELQQRIVRNNSYSLKLFEAVVVAWAGSVTEA